jgi:CRP/FNR family transcriptional regulator, cyclic AMP receptor protein
MWRRCCARPRCSAASTRPTCRPSRISSSSSTRATGTVVFEEGEPGDSLYVVMAGKVKLGCPGPGRENLVAVTGPSDEFGELSLFDPGPRTVTATMVTDARLARLPNDALQHWVYTRPQIAMRLLWVLAHRLRRTNTMLEDLVFVHVPGRVAKSCSNY